MTKFRVVSSDVVTRCNMWQIF